MGHTALQYARRLTERIVNALALQLTPQEAQRVAVPGTDNVAAHDAYLLGLSYYNLAANEADSKGYDVYVVFYDETNDDVAAAFFEGLIRGSGLFRRTPNSDELDEMMFDLCTSAMDLQLVM